LGNTYYRQGKLREAINFYQEAVTRSPKDTHFLISLGQVQDHAGDSNSAILTLRRAIEADPRYPPAYLVLGELYLRRREYEQALSQFRIVRNLDHENITALIGTARSFEEMGLLTQAKEFYDKTLLIDHNNNLAAQGLKRVLEKQDNKK
jgi:tetratricopeptide (TPR) repeat protein